MPSPICPYLGLQDDPNTALEYPAAANMCNHANPVGSINAEHQRDFCLTSQHMACPVYQRNYMAPLPADIAAPAPAPANPSVRQRLIPGAVLAALVTALLVFGSGSVLAKLGFRPLGLPVTGLSGTATAFQPGSEFTPTVDGNYGLLFAFTPSPNATFASCPAPQGWTTYIVKPTDSLIRLSLLYRVSIEDLQHANCLGNETLIEPGDWLYVPMLPTATPTLIPTPTLLPYVPNVFLPPTSGGNNNPPAPSATSVPPSSTPAPTSTPNQPTAKPTNPPPPTKEPKPTEPPPPTKEPKPTKAPKPTKVKRGSALDLYTSPVLTAIFQMYPPAYLFEHIDNS